MNIPQKKGETRKQTVGNVTPAAKRIACEMNFCFKLLSQMTRESDKVLKPMLSI